MTHICVRKLTIIGSDNGMSPGRRQAIIWNNTGLLLIEPLGTNFSEISIGIQTFSFNKMHLKVSSAKWRPFCLGLNVLITKAYYNHTYSGNIHAIYANVWCMLIRKYILARNSENVHISSLTIFNNGTDHTAIFRKSPLHNDRTD